MVSRSQPSGRRADALSAGRNAPRSAATTKALDWFQARQRGERLPEHMLPEDVESALATQRMETMP